MKTSNKILLIFLSIPVLIMISFFLIARSQMKPVSWIEPSGVVKKQVLNLPDFEKLQVSNGVEVTLVPGLKTVEVETDENYLPLLESNSENGILSLRMKRGSRIRAKNTQIGIRVGTENIREISSSGTGQIRCADTLRRNELRLFANGEAQMQIIVKTNYLYAGLSGPGGIELMGSTDELEASVSGEGDFHATALKAREVRIQLNGPGDAQVWATDLLDANISGEGTVSYLGTPAKVKDNINGPGNLKPL